MNNTNPLWILSSAKVYEEAILRLMDKQRQGVRTDVADSQELSLKTAFMKSQILSKLLAKTVSKGEYKFGPCRERWAFVAGKERALYRYGLIDTIVESVLARMFQKIIRPNLSQCVYSYQKGLSSLKAIRDFAAYLKKHREERPNCKDRGLYVLRRDISNYGESIPTDSNSKVWNLIQDTLSAHSSHSLYRVVQKLINSAICPTVIFLNGKQGVLPVGIPTGTGIQPSICNLYLTSLDRELERIEGGFYARYGDDILFAHPDPSIAKNASNVIQDCLEDLRLKLNSKKSKDLYFTKPGRPPHPAGFAKPASFIEYLGCNIGFSGEVRLKTAKAKSLLKDLKTRIRSAGATLADVDQDTLAQTLCQITNRALDPKDELSHPAAAILMGVVNDRSQLGQLDYLVALMISAVVTGRTGVKSFRHLSYRNLRRLHGLSSLTARRNRGNKPNKQS